MPKPPLSTEFVLAIALGAVPGAISRYYIGQFIKETWGESFGYYGTFLVNITGCLLIAYILTLAAESLRPPSPRLRVLLTTGFCGAYTTFSAYGLETQQLLEQGNSIALLYGAGSPILGMVAIQGGVWLARASKHLIGHDS
ncbi:MAG: fluoride efflux transporter CrcB [Leptolyngbyaceae cyanobacterium bins.59]|nr:fluoride efflux transporter CrcB [Leptolyngbyaceae cyanobacterium bins.59]